jgi:putative NADPH-quinone reductase
MIKEYVDQLDQEREFRENETDVMYKKGLLKDSKVSITVTINGNTEVIPFEFTHDTTIESIDVFSEYVGQKVSDRVENLIIDMVKTQHDNTI